MFNTFIYYSQVIYQFIRSIWKCLLSKLTLTVSLSKDVKHQASMLFSQSESQVVD